MKFTTRILCLGLCLLLLLPTLFSCQNEDLKSAPLRDGAFRLAEHGKSDYRVVIGKDASEDTKKMAEEFVRYFEQICGAKLSVVTDETEPQDKEFIIGKTSRAADGELPYDELGQEGYAYADVNASIVMSGNTDRAVAYSVYAFLEERLGVLYLSADYEYIPKRNALDVMGDLENQSVPGFWYRDMGHIGHNDSEWMVKMRLNSRQSLGSENYRKNPFVGGGEGYADWFVHTIGKLAEMPKNDDGTHFNTQPCLTDENVYQTVLKNVRAWLEQYPDATIVSVSQNDGTQESSMCACDNCKKIYNNYGNVQSALWIWFVCRIATELADEYPDVHFETLSYNFTTMPPKGLSIPENIIVRCVPAFCCLNHSLLDETCHNAHGNSSQKKSDLFRKTLVEWSALANNIFIWDYATLFHNYWAPFLNLDALRQNMNYYADNGVQGVYMQGADTNAPFGELYAYLTAKLLWNPQMNEREFQKLTREFMENFYGKGTSKPLMEYINVFSESISDQHFHLYGRLFEDYCTLPVCENEQGTILDTTLIQKMRDCFDRAEALVTDDTLNMHLKKAKVQVLYYELCALFKLEEKYENAIIDLDYRRALGEELYNCAKAGGFTNIGEGSGGKLPENPNFDYPPSGWHNKTTKNG